MKRLVFAILALYGAMASAQEAGVEAAFETIMHPVLRKNCAECHAETAIYPAGPTHSHSDAKKAFLTFSKFIDVRNQPETSRVFMMATNQHYCKVYQFNCDIADQVVAEVQSALRDFVLTGRASEAETPSAPALALETLEARYPGIAKIPRRTMRLSGITIRPGEVINAVDERADLGVTFKVKELPDGYLEIQEIKFTALRGKALIPRFYLLKNARVLINGQVLKGSLYEEGRPRVIGLVPGAKYRMSAYPPEIDKKMDSLLVESQLPLDERIVRARAQDLSLEFEISELEKMPSNICERASEAELSELRTALYYFQPALTDPSLSIQEEFAALQALTFAQICAVIETRFTPGAPPRTPFLQAITSGEARARMLLGMRNLFRQSVSN